MAAQLSFVLFITLLTGGLSVITVNEVSVKAGDSVSIPCLYDSQYREQVKHLCKGFYWKSCEYVAQTNQPSPEKFSISNDRNQSIVTVTINNLTDQDTDYWCAVETERRSVVRQYFHLSVTKDTPSLYVDQQRIRTFEEDSISIQCFHRNSGETRWCRVGGSCVKGSSGSIGGTRVTIDTSVPGVFTVTMNGLRMERSGWYWCVNGNLQMPVHLTVTEKPTTTTSSITTLFLNTDSVNLTSGLINLIIPLICLLFIVTLLIIWLVFKTRKQTKVQASATTLAEEQVTYSNVKYKRKPNAKGSDAQMKSDVDVIYTSVVIGEPRNKQRTEADGDVRYSTLAQL